MINPTDGPTREEETIKKLVWRTRRIATVWKGIAVGTLAFGLALAYGMMTHMGDHRPGSFKDIFWLGLPTVSGLLICFLMLSEQQRLSKAGHSLDDRLARGRSHAGRTVSSSTIGPLLELSLTGPCYHLPAVLLCDLLNSVREEEEVVLTANQRCLLHVLVLEGPWDSFNMRSGAAVEKTARCELRPAAIGSLALLGNRSSIAVLERFARKTDDSNLRQAALLSIEQIRSRLQYDPEQMLRASRAPERPETLLRAVSSGKSQSSDPQQLLQAADDNRDSPKASVS